jgi:signal transduction histidine kinase
MFQAIDDPCEKRVFLDSLSRWMTIGFLQSSLSVPLKAPATTTADFRVFRGALTNVARQDDASKMAVHLRSERKA